MPASIGQQLLDVPFGEMIRSLGGAIADAQLQLDLTSAKIAQIMAGETYEIRNDRGEVVETIGPVKVGIGGEELSMLELGFTPTFYQFVDTIIEVKISISITSEESTAKSSKQKTLSGKGAMIGPVGSGSLKASSVNASYAAKYSYHAEGSSLIRTKLVPLPPPPLFEERIRKLIESKTSQG